MPARAQSPRSAPALARSRPRTMPSGASRAAIRSASAALAAREVELDPPDPVRAEIGFADHHDIAVGPVGREMGARRRPPPTSSAPNRTTRIVRRGRPACMIRCAAAVVIATPAALSIAPVPRSQLSRWPPISDHPGARIAPGTSATTLPDWRRPRLRGVRSGASAPAGRRRGRGCAAAARRRGGKARRPGSAARPGKICTPVCGLR